MVPTRQSGAMATRLQKSINPAAGAFQWNPRDERSDESFVSAIVSRSPNTQSNGGCSKGERVGA